MEALHDLCYLYEQNLFKADARALFKAHRGGNDQFYAVAAPTWIDGFKNSLHDAISCKMPEAVQSFGSS